MYAQGNPKTKKELKERVASGEEVRVLNNSPFGSSTPTGEVSIEGPHSPEPHRWYARARVVDGVIKSVK